MYSSSDMSRISSSFNCTPTARTTRLLGARGFGGGGACFGVAAGFTGDFATAAVFDGLPLFCTLAFPASDFAIFLGAGRAAGLAAVGVFFATDLARSEEHTSELQSLMRISYAVFCLKKKTTPQ